MTILTGEPKFDLHHATIGALLELIAIDNHPMTATGSVGGAQGFESKTPGRQNAAGAVEAAERALIKCEEALARVHNNARVREHHDSPAQSIGSVDVSAPEGISATRKVSPNVTASRLAAKYGEVSTTP